MRSLAVVVVAVSAAVVPAAAGKATPGVRVVDRHPLTLVGTAFGPRERVLVTVRPEDDPPVRRSVRASRSGAFRLVLSTATPHRCSGLSVTAAGSSGAVAKAKLPSALCPLPLRP